MKNKKAKKVFKTFLEKSVQYLKLNNVEVVCMYAMYFFFAGPLVTNSENVPGAALKAFIGFFVWIPFVLLSYKAYKLQSGSTNLYPKAAPYAARANGGNAYLGNKNTVGNLPETSLQVEILWKRAHLFYDNKTQKFMVKGFNHTKMHGLKDVKHCKGDKNKRHSFTKCTCGFHAYNTFLDAACHTMDKKTPLVGVKPTGEVIQYEKGWRYSNQQVTNMLFWECANCHKHPDNVFYSKKGCALVIPFCQKHAPAESVNFKTLKQHVKETTGLTVEVSDTQKVTGLAN